MVLHWLLVINLSVFATKLAAFVLVLSSVISKALSGRVSPSQLCVLGYNLSQVCREVLSEVGKFLEPWLKSLCQAFATQLRGLALVAALAPKITFSISRYIYTVYCVKGFAAMAEVAIIFILITFSSAIATLRQLSSVVGCI